MNYDELEVDAQLIEIVENQGGFDEIDDEELIEIVEQIVKLTDGDYEEAYEYLIQYAPLNKKRFLSLCMI